MLTVTLENLDDLKWVQANQKKLNETVESAIPEVVRIARRCAPKKTGLLRKGIIAMPGLEHTRFKGKAVGQVVINKAMNSVFRKPNPKGPDHYYYYPASQEYGFKRRVRGGGTKHIPGKYYMRTASRVYEKTLAIKVDNMLEDLFSERD